MLEQSGEGAGWTVRWFQEVAPRIHLLMGEWEWIAIEGVLPMEASGQLLSEVDAILHQSALGAVLVSTLPVFAECSRHVGRQLWPLLCHGYGLICIGPLVVQESNWVVYNPRHLRCTDTALLAHLCILSRGTPTPLVAPVPVIEPDTLTAPSPPLKVHPECFQMLERERVILPSAITYFEDSAVEGPAAHSRRHDGAGHIRTSTTLSGAVAYVLRQTGLSVSRTWIHRRMVPARWGSVAARAHRVFINVRPATRAKEDKIEDQSTDRHFAAAEICLRRAACGSGPSDTWSRSSTGFVPIPGARTLSTDDKATISCLGSAVERPSPVNCPIDPMTGTILRIKTGKHDFNRARGPKIIAHAVLSLDAMDGLGPAPGKSARTSGAVTYVLREGSEGQSPAHHLAELLWAIAEQPDRFKNSSGELASSLCIIVDGGGQENPRHYGCLVTNAYLRDAYSFSEFPLFLLT